MNYFHKLSFLLFLHKSKTFMGNIHHNCPYTYTISFIYFCITFTRMSSTHEWSGTSNLASCCFMCRLRAKLVLNLLSQEGQVKARGRRWMVCTWFLCTDRVLNEAPHTSHRNARSSECVAWDEWDATWYWVSCAVYFTVLLKSTHNLSIYCTYQRCEEDGWVWYSRNLWRTALQIYFLL